MSNWIEPEWLPRVPGNDRGPFHCYVFWVADTRKYYVGHTSDPEERIRRHFRGGVRTTAGYDLKCLWVSDPIRSRRDAADFEAALKSYVRSGNGVDFKRCTGLYFMRGATLLDHP